MKPNNHTQEKAFQIHTYQFRELALQYFPTSTPNTASRAFRKMIDACRGLPEAMHEKGFRPKRRLLSPAIVATIVEHLGEP